MQQAFIQTVQNAIIVPRQGTKEQGEEKQLEVGRCEKERVVGHKEQIVLEVEDDQVKEIVIQQVRQSTNM